MIENCIPELEGNELAYVQEAIGAGDLAVGRFLGAFEDTIKAATGAQHAVAVTSGTAALHLCLVVAGVREGDIVIVPALTFAGTVNALLLCGARPAIIDCTTQNWALDPDSLDRFLSEECSAGTDGRVHRATGRRIGAIIPVHLYGHPADMDAISAIATRYGNIAIVEDAAEALGARSRDRPIGSEAKFAALSFNGNKIVTSAGGGMVLTNDQSLAERCRYLANQAKDANIDFVHRAPGFNYRLSNIQAAIGLAQSEGLARRIERKRRIAQHYMEAFGSHNGIEILREEPHAYSTYWMPIVIWQPELNPTHAVEIARELAAIGIGVRPVWRPLNEQPLFEKLGGPATPVSHDLYRRSLCLPCSTSISEAEIDATVKAVTNRLAGRKAA